LNMENISMTSMVIKPKVRGFICTAAHPEGCYKVVEEQVNYVKHQGTFNGPKNVLVIGASTGYGLASRIVASFACQADTIGVSFERPAEGNRTASPGWYNTAAFEALAHQQGRYAKSIIGDAFSNEIKQQVVALLKQEHRPIDLLVYSVAAPRRTDPRTGATYSSVLKPIGQRYANKTVDPLTGVVKDIVIEPADEAEIAATEAVMGGDDWAMWIDLLLQEGLLAPKAITIAYSYIGPALTHPIYKDGTIGRAKQHLQQTAAALNKKLAALQGHALISVNKALVTQASAAIPVVPLYISILFKIMKEQGVHEGCIEQIYRLFKEHLYTEKQPLVNAEGAIRIDDKEMDAKIQTKVTELWEKITTDNIEALTDIKGYRDDFYRLFGFGLANVDYDREVDPNVAIN
jgi:enoyl-[acyl-carrier protein] reductase / trans-2-enoyl-CoA reductase (NAD+)